MGTRHMITATVVSLTLVLAFGGCSQSPEAKKAKHRERAITYFDKGQFQEAVIEFKNVVQLDPKDSEGHYRLALTYLKIGGLGGLQGAFGELTRTVELDPSNRDAQLKLGELYLMGSEPAKSREREDIILASAPKDPEGLVLRGQSFISEKEFKQGIAELKKAIEADPQNTRSYLNLAAAYVQKKDLAAAEATYQQALKADPRSVEARVAFGDFRLFSGKPDEAETEYKRALDVEPNNEWLHLKLAGFYQVTRKWADAEAVYQKLATLKPKDDKPQILLGDFYTYLGQHDKALASYQRATEIAPASVPARNKLIAHYLDTGKLAEAEGRVKPILEKNKKDLDGRFFDARLRLARGKSEEVIELLQGVIKDDPQWAPGHQFLGLAFAAKNDVAQARRELTEAVKLNPNLAEARTALAAIHLAAGSFDLAIEEAQAALRLNPRNIKAAGSLGDAYLRKNELDKGQQVFESMAKALPKEPIVLYRLGLIARAQRKDEALSYFEQALAANPNAIEPLTQ